MKMKKIIIPVLVFAMLFSACAKMQENETTDSALSDDESFAADVTEIKLSDAEITVDGNSISTEKTEAVYSAEDIIYYESGNDFTYGEGSEKDAHSKEDADLHTVVHITKAGTYSVCGKISKGQLAIDLGEGAKDNKDAVVTLILNGIDITCEVAPAIIFYNVYECGNADSENADKDVDTTNAGANVIIVDDTVNIVNGSYVERIYKPGTVILSEDGTEVEDAEKLHKYDGAFYSKMSMNINGGKNGTGTLNIIADNEGLDSELHLTINGGNININSGNDGINTNEDGVSVATINGGKLCIKVTGETGEGDGIDSNGWLVINGGRVEAAACSFSEDAGIDSDMGIHINGGYVIATGSMLDRIEDGSRNYVVINFSEKQDKSKGKISLKDKDGKITEEYYPENDFSVLIFSSPALTEGTYSLWQGNVQLEAVSGEMAGGFNPGMPPEGMPPEGMSPEGMSPDKMPSEEISSGFPEDNSRPGMPAGEMMPPEDFSRPERPGEYAPDTETGEFSKEIKIKNGANMLTVK